MIPSENMQFCSCQLLHEILFLSNLCCICWVILTRSRWNVQYLVHVTTSGSGMGYVRQFKVWNTVGAVRINGNTVSIIPTDTVWNICHLLCLNLLDWVFVLRECFVCFVFLCLVWKLGGILLSKISSCCGISQRDGFNIIITTQDCARLYACAYNLNRRAALPHKGTA